MAALILVGLLLASLGLALLVGAVLTYVKGKRETARCIAATGRVIQLVRQRRVYCPVVEFAGPAGQTMTFLSPFGTLPASYAIGQSIAIRYDPADPRKAFVDSELAAWLVPGIMGALGVLFGFVGFVLFVIGVLFVV